MWSKDFQVKKFCEKFGLDVLEYQERLAEGKERYCTYHKVWEPVEMFYNSPSHRAMCKEAQRLRSRELHKTYIPPGERMKREAVEILSDLGWKWDKELGWIK